jgi:hypothetical protein
MKSWPNIPILILLVAAGSCRGFDRGCEVRWRLGEIDPRFEIDAHDVLTAAFNAADAWNAAAGRRVLRYDKDEGIPLKLVYDEHSANLSSGLAELRELRKLDVAIANLQKQYDANPSDYIANRINLYIKRYNQLVLSLNTRARDDIRQGSFQTELQINAFADMADLQMVIAHEFGHALGIGHPDAPNAVMSAFHQVGTQALQLTDADIAALRDVCR